MSYEVITPKTTEELLRQISQHQDKNFRYCAGGTDILLELKRKPPGDLKVLNLAYIDDPLFTQIAPVDGGLRIGSLVTANAMIANVTLSANFSVLHKAAHSLASCQIREVATVGGNIGTASPAGDISCALMALEAECEILDCRNQVRVVPIREFFTGVRKTGMKRDEILRSIVLKSIPKGSSEISDFIKIGTRRSMECSVVSLAYRILTDAEGTVLKAGIAIGSVAPTIKFAAGAANYLIGRKFTKVTLEEAIKFADLVCEYASPISDVRVSAWYRSETLRNISKGIFAE